MDDTAQDAAADAPGALAGPNTARGRKQHGVSVRGQAVKSAQRRTLSAPGMVREAARQVFADIKDVPRSHPL
ncbi:hypothetical protein GCM10010467_12450 [Actinocorallia glomerata]|uniref:Uncharacterized protein n=2 Tax=Actinomycetes TaxID=1760 RepID=A0ABP6LNN0_9MICC